MADNVRNSLEDVLSRIAILDLAQTDEAVGAFNTFRRGLEQASKRSESNLNDFLEDLHPKAPLLDLLVSLHGQKRTYRKQIAGVWTTLLGCDSWLRAAYDNRMAWSQLPDELQKVLQSRDRPITPRAAVVETDYVETSISPSDMESNVVQSANVPSDSRVLAAVNAAEAAHGKPSTFSGNKSFATGSMANMTFFRQPPELELQNAMQLISRCQQSKDRDEGLVAFDSFQRALSRILSLKVESLEKVLEDIEPKVLTFEFLVDVHLRNKIQRKKVCTVFKTLAGIASWHKALTSDSALCKNLPIELRVAMAEVPETADVVLPGDQRIVGLNKLQKHAASSSSLESTRDSMTISREISKATDRSLPTSPMMLGTESMMSDSDLFDGVTFDCKELQASIVTMRGLSYRASPIDDARDAFDRFARGVRQAVRSLPNDYIDVLDSLEPKAQILEFFVDLHKLEKNKKRCNALRSLLFRLKDLRPWNKAMDGDRQLHAIMAEGLPGQKPPALVVASCFCVSPQPRRRSNGSERKPKKAEDGSNSIAVEEDALLTRSWYSRAFDSLTSRS
jgi:hypothetical protein